MEGDECEGDDGIPDRIRENYGRSEVGSKGLRDIESEDDYNDEDDDDEDEEDDEDDVKMKR